VLPVEGQTKMPSIARIDRRMLAAITPALLSATLGACYRPVDPELPNGSVQFEAPSAYSRWWTMVQTCSGLGGDITTVSWYRVPTGADVVEGSSSIDGYWAPSTNRIVLSAGSVLDGGVVRHEMLHALLRSVDHSRLMFLDKCGGVVDCARDCIRDAGPPPPPDANAPTISASALEMGTSIEPAPPSASRDSGCFTLTVTVTNPRPIPVVVPLGGSRATFSYELRDASGAGAQGGVIALDPSDSTFGPGETKRQVFDFRVGLDTSGGKWRPGHYTIGGAYAGQWVRRPLDLNP
jgi:hypothetical protein